LSTGAENASIKGIRALNNSEATRAANGRFVRGWA
jgi:hypothetical protein